MATVTVAGSRLPRSPKQLTVWGEGPTPVTIRKGSVVLVRRDDPAAESFMAVVADIMSSGTARLTFTPKGAPRKVPVTNIVCCATPAHATMEELALVPRYQPEVTVQVRRRQRRKVLI